MKVLLFISENFASLLPGRYRRLQVSGSSALVSGAEQFVLCLGIFIYRYIHFAQNRLFTTTTVLMKAAEAGGDTAIMGSGIFVLLEYMIHPLTLALIYFIFEGLVRGTAALVTGEIVPTLPLAAIAWIHGKMDDVGSEMALGKRVSDQVKSVDSPDIKLRIESCRPKASWDQRVTVFYKDELYEVAEEQTGEPPHRFVYLLRHKPLNKLVRGIHHYDPDEALR
jgi:hypothetical protein